jgi:hypothetical protein
MTLEISEIGIRLAIGDPVPPSVPRGGPAAAQGGAPISPQLMETLVGACVQEVLRTLRMLEER